MSERGREGQSVYVTPKSRCGMGRRVSGRGGDRQRGGGLNVGPLTVTARNSGSDILPETDIRRAEKHTVPTRLTLSNNWPNDRHVGAHDSSTNTTLTLLSNDKPSFFHIFALISIVVSNVIISEE